MLKISENPAVLFPEDIELAEIPGQWWVAHTRSRAEKALAQMLCRWQIPYFLPLAERVTRRKGRQLKSLLPIFSGYMFFCGTPDQRYAAMTSNKIAQVIEVHDQAGLVQELTQINRALKSGVPVDRYPNLTTGKRCRVVAGPLAGLEGVLLRKKNCLRLLLEVRILGQAAAVEIDADLLEPAD